MGKMEKTQKEFYGEMIEIFADMERQDLVEFCQGRIELLNKKANSSVNAKGQEENNKIMEILYIELEKLNRAVTLTELKNDSQVLKDYRTENGGELSNQKISALMKKLKESGRVNNKKEGKKSLYFTV